jgi:hypothetical protein
VDVVLGEVRAPHEQAARGREHQSGDGPHPDEHPVDRAAVQLDDVVPGRCLCRCCAERPTLGCNGHLMSSVSFPDPTIRSTSDGTDRPVRALGPKVPTGPAVGPFVARPGRVPAATA